VAKSPAESFGQVVFEDAGPADEVVRGAPSGDAERGQVRPSRQTGSEDIDPPVLGLSSTLI
jgi:hypothetical protein